MQQTELDFTTGSKINKENLSKSNKKVYEWLKSGDTIDCFYCEARGVKNLFARIWDLINKVKIPEEIYRRQVFKNGSKITQYSLTPFKENN